MPVAIPSSASVPRSTQATELDTLQGRWKDASGNCWYITGKRADVKLRDGRWQTHYLQEFKNGRCRVLSASIQGEDANGTLSWSDGDWWERVREQPGQNPGASEYNDMQHHRGDDRGDHGRSWEYDGYLKYKHNLKKASKEQPFVKQAVPQEQQTRRGDLSPPRREDTPPLAGGKRKGVVLEISPPRKSRGASLSRRSEMSPPLATRDDAATLREQVQSLSDTVARQARELAAKDNELAARDKEIASLKEQLTSRQAPSNMAAIRERERRHYMLLNDLGRSGETGHTMSPPGYSPHPHDAAEQNYDRRPPCNYPSSPSYVDPALASPPKPSYPTSTQHPVPTQHPAYDEAHYSSEAALSPSRPLYDSPHPETRHHPSARASPIIGIDVERERRHEMLLSGVLSPPAAPTPAPVSTPPLRAAPESSLPHRATPENSHALRAAPESSLPQREDAPSRTTDTVPRCLSPVEQRRRSLGLMK